MPTCEPWCPLVKEQLKKIATEAPWVLNKEVHLERQALLEQRSLLEQKLVRDEAGKIDYRGVPKVDRAIDAVKEVRKTEIATGIAPEARDKLIETDAADQISKRVGDSEQEILLEEERRLEHERLEKLKKMEGESSKVDAAVDEREDATISRDESYESSLRRLSRSK